MIALLAFLGYLTVSGLAAKVAARAIHAHGECHSQRAQTSFSDICARYHPGDCWRPRESGVTYSQAWLACLIGLAWPVAGLPYLVMTTFKPIPRPYRERIEELERELGMLP